MTGTVIFGHLDGTAVPAVTFGDGAGSSATVIGFGATLRDLFVPGRNGRQRVVLGLATLDEYARHGKSFGAIVGRYANRIAGARFRLDGREHRLCANEGPNTLHGGPRGFGTRLWSLAEAGPGHCRFALESKDGEMGFPGRVQASATYRFVGPGHLQIRLEAFTDAPTPLNLTSHAYFNLDGTPDIRDHHRLRVAASHHVVVGPDGIPSGAIAPVADTIFDFREARSPRVPAGSAATVDSTLVLDRDHDRGPGLRAAASLVSERSGVVMSLATTEPGLQVYDGSKVDLDVAGLDGQALRPFCGLALEAQRFPDGPNQAHFPDCILRPDAPSLQDTELVFTLLGSV